MEHRAQIRADFLPENSSTDKDLKQAVLANLDKTLELIKPLPIQTKLFSMEQISDISTGVYRLDVPPDLEFWKSSVEIIGTKPKYGEVGLIGLSNKIIISINRRGLYTAGVSFPRPLEVIFNEGIFEFDIHSHPFGVLHAQFPSLDTDFSNPKSTHTGLLHIFSPWGLTTFNPSLTTIPDKYKGSSVKYWLDDWRNRKKKEYMDDHPHEAFDDRKFRQLYGDFFVEHFDLKIFMWNQKEIAEEYHRITERI